MRTVFLFGLLLGCAEPAVDAVPELDKTPYAVPDPIYEEEPQGRWLLGSVPDRLTNVPGGAKHFSVGRDSTNRQGHRASVVNGSLVVRTFAGAPLYSGTDDAINNLELTSASGVTIQIKDGVLDAYGGPAYELVYLNSNNEWVDYCEDGDLAVAMQGSWSSTGFHQTTTEISFGCRDGVTFKCFDWGYVPGQPGSLAWRIHQACTRMARADVCGDGVPHTRELTPIVIRDLVPNYNDSPGTTPALRHVTTMPPPPDLHFYEAAWASGDNEGAVCLEKQRWASLPVGMSCGLLQDPRDTIGAKYCEELTSEQLVARGALTVNASKTYDMYMHRWRNPNTGDVVSTVRGYYSLGTDFEEPFTDYDDYLGSDGILLRNLPGSLSASDVVEVFSTGTLDRVLLPDATLTRKDPSFEGYLLRNHGGDRVPFNIYRRGTDTLTSVDPEDETFKLTGPLFYAITP